MSLWVPDIDAVDFSAIEAFCRKRVPEGVRLDYKGPAIPKNIEELIAAFANTMGGIIVLGVGTDNQNRPIWPPEGIDNQPGLEEQIIQKAQDAIWPPILPEVRLVPDPSNGKKLVGLIRVRESREAPHAVEKNRKVYVRVASIKRGYELALAEVPEIQRLVQRRASLEQSRETQIRLAMERADIRIGDHDPAVRLWASLIPYYPWRDLCKPVKCWDFHRGWQDRDDFSIGQRVQRMPEGSFGLRSGPVGFDRYYVFESPSGVGDWHMAGCSSINASGHVFRMQHQFHGGYTTGERFINLAAVCRFARCLICCAKEFYESEVSEPPGEYLLSVGLLNVRNAQMVLNAETRPPGRHFLDASYRVDEVISLDQMLSESSDASVPSAASALFEKLAFAFDLDSPSQAGR